MKIALGMIIRSLESETEILNFIDNAEKYGHKLDCVIVAYTLRLDERVAGKINGRIPLVAVNVNKPGHILDKFRRLGMSEDTVKTLTECPIDTSRGLVPYGFNRNIVLMEALLREMDALFFVDSDVYPVVLGHGGGSFVKEEADFFGAHLEHLRAGAEVTTAEYSGYNILPPASFDGMADLAAGVQKEDKVAFWQKSPEHKTLTLQPRERVVKPCAKILGGNAAVKLGAFSKLPPFFSSHYDLNGETFLARGEDTLLGLGIERSGLTCTDIALHILHDTYKDFPKEPDLKCDKSVQERFYYACTGWVGRNPFMNHLLGSDLKATREYQRERLAPGLASLAKYTSNPKFNTVLGNFDKSWDNVGRYVNEYEQTLEAWGEFTERIGLIS